MSSFAFYAPRSGPAHEVAKAAPRNRTRRNGWTRSSPIGYGAGRLPSSALARQPRHRKIQRSPAWGDLRRRIRLRRSDQQDERRPRLGVANKERFAHQKETERRLLTNGVAGIRHNAEQNIALGTADCALDRAFHCVAFDELDDPPTILGQLDNPFGRQGRLGRLTILGRPYQIEDRLRDSRIVDYCIGRAKRMHGKWREVTQIAV